MDSPVIGHPTFSTLEGIGWVRVDTENSDMNNLRLLELQSDIFQKNASYGFKTELTQTKEEAVLLSSLSNNNAWVEFFIQSIVNYANTNGFSTISFPIKDTVKKIQWEGDEASVSKGVMDFYSNTVRKKLVNKYGKRISSYKDKNGNTWLKLELDEVQDNKNVLFQKVKHNKSEIADVAGLMRELGYNTKGQLERDVTVNEILDNQIQILEDLKTKGTSDIAGIIDWIDTSKHEDPADRAGRGRKHALKYGTGKSKYTGETGQVAPTEAEQRKHLEMQIAEELLEVIEEKGNIPSTVEKMLEQQKRAFKSLRFLGNTVNKDSGLTNDQQLKKELAGTKYEKVPIRTDKDKYDLIQRIAKDIKAELGQEIVLQKQNGRIKGQANIEAGTVLINSLLQSQDTLPHEYAHHYIAWFRDAPIVQEAVKKWGSEEALVQAIGEQVVKQEGEAYGWWKKFTQWLQEKFNKLDKATKEELKNVLTDAFLARQDLTKIKVSQETQLETANSTELINMAEQSIC